MKTLAKLPRTNTLGFYEIRFESIGGLGANLASQILAEAGVLDLGYNGAQFSSYGSEKKGAPVKSFIRFCNRGHDVRSSTPVEEPHLVAVFHEALLRSLPVASGLHHNGTIVVNTRHTTGEIAEQLKLSGAVVGVIDALQIAVEEGSRVNTAMLGAVVRASGFLDRDVVREALERSFPKKYASLLHANLRTFDRGYDELTLEAFPGEQPASTRVNKTVPRLGYLNAPIGGAIINPGNSIVRDLSSTRVGFIPDFLRDKCIDCGLCDMVCPDFCFVWGEGADKRGKPQMVLKGIDYQYCKGCLKCTVACPTDALVELREPEGYAVEHAVKHYVDLNRAAASVAAPARGQELTGTLHATHRLSSAFHSKLGGEKA